MVRSRSSFALVLFLLAAAPAVAQQVELLDFYLPTCAPCRAMAPVIDRLAAQGTPVRKIDGSREPQLAQRFRVDSYPTFIIMVDGVESGRVVGATSEQSLRTLLARAGAKRPAATTAVAASSRTFSAGPDRDFMVGPDAGPGMTAPAQGVIASNPGNAELVESSVRLTVEDATGRSHGTGTIIDARSGEALIVTCAHLFRDAAGQAIDTEGRLSIEIFQPGPTGPQVVQRVAGSLVVHDFEADVALVRMRPTAPVKAARVASSPGSIIVRAAVRSVGCDLGADPTVRESRVVTIDRYNGPPNIETTGAPVQGRSGGGLFNDSGELIGVCFAADNEADEGLYAGLASIHAQIDRIGLSDLYRAGASPQEPAPLPLAMAEPAAVQSLEPSRASRLEPVAPWPDPIIRGQNEPNPAALSPVERATLDEITQRRATSEVVLLIRPREPGGKTEVLTLDAASPAMVEALRTMGTTSAVR